MKQIEFNLTQLRRDFLERRCHLEGLSDEEVDEAWAEYERAHPLPLTPSKEDPTREAECLICLDFEWVHPLLFDGKLDYSRVKPCKCYWEKYGDEIGQKRFERSGIPIVHRERTFESFIPVDGTDDALQAAWGLAKGTSPFRLLLLYGGHGNGKTHLAYAAAVLRHNRGENVKYSIFAKMFLRMSHAMNGSGHESVADIISEMSECDFLVLDDLGAYKDSEWKDEVTETIINYRYENRLPTLITTNLDIKATDRNQRVVLEAIVSRFRDKEISMIVQNKGADYRPRLKRGE